VNSMGNLS